MDPDEILMGWRLQSNYTVNILYNLLNGDLDMLITETGSFFGLFGL